MQLLLLLLVLFGGTNLARVEVVEEGNNCFKVALVKSFCCHRKTKVDHQTYAEDFFFANNSTGQQTDKLLKSVFLANDKKTFS